MYAVKSDIAETSWNFYDKKQGALYQSTKFKWDQIISSATISLNCRVCFTF